jgi:predicted transposase/invertase (TIGR01784 family)
MEHRNREGKSMYIPLMLRDRADELIEKGVEKGVEKAKLEDARNMLAKGIATELVVEITGLPEERIKRLMN